jgi:large subunit ribosomal protein L13
MNQIKGAVLEGVRRNLKPRGMCPLGSDGVIDMKVYDAKGAILGRLGTRVAKALLLGEEVAVVNAGEAVISGKASYIVGTYMARRRVKNKANPEQSPHWPRRPDLLVKRIFRGMLPYKAAKGRAAFKRLKVYSGQPESLGKAERFPEVDCSRLKVKFMTVNELCKDLGYRVFQ